MALTRKMFRRGAVLVAVLLGLAVSPSLAEQKQDKAGSPLIPEHVLGKATAPVTVVEYASATCSHCADFYAKVMPEIEKKYIDTGKVRFIFHNFPLDGLSLKASSLANCMPAKDYYPFIKIIFNNAKAWLGSEKPEATLLQYAQMMGLDGDKAKSCVEDTKILDALVAARAAAGDKYEIKATPTFIINDGEDRIVGAVTFEEFSAKIDKALARKK